MAIEARSFAHLTNLASNPPNYPQNPTETAHSQITLYIVRVPGSRDVFLTPLKPRDKVVNAQDVQSSLYFLHIDDPEDSRVSAPLEEPNSPPLERHSPSPIARKPLPTPPVTPEDEQSPGLPDLHPTSPFKHLQIPTRKPVVPPRNPRRSIENRTPPPAPKSPTIKVSGDNGTCLTLIRRDPASGAQWNVAKIRDPPVEDVSSETYAGPDHAAFKAKNSGAPMYIDVSNPGYSKFLQYNQSTRRSQDGMSAPNDSDPADFASDRVFKRRLWMEGSRYADHSYTNRRAINSSSDNPILPTSFGAGSNHSSSRVAVDHRSKGYTFLSPWGGKCEFSTGIAGRSLKVDLPSSSSCISITDYCKCKHRHDALASHNETITEVSELRFNLPTHASRFGHASVDLDNDHRSSYFAPSSNHRPSRSESFIESEPHWTTMRNEDGKIDYSLGRERAGGGFGGKQAKLGKLIVEDEGQKMLDLVVAANLALWWRAYERK